MGLSVKQIIEVRCPGLYTSTGLDIYIEIAENQISSCYYGSNRNLAVALLSCHQYTMDQRGGTAGTISTKREGDLSVSYSTIASKNGGSDLDQTSYGKELQSLTRKSGSGAISVTGADITCLNSNIIPCE